MQRVSSCDVAPLRTPPPGRSGEAMFRIAILRRCGGGLRVVWRWCAAERVSVAMIRMMKEGVVGGSDDGGCIDIGLVCTLIIFSRAAVGAVSLLESLAGLEISSAPSTPFFARGVEDIRAGMVLFTVLLACFARIPFLFAGGWRPCEGSVRPISMFREFLSLQ